MWRRPNQRWRMSATVTAVTLVVMCGGIVSACGSSSSSNNSSSSSGGSGASSSSGGSSSGGSMPGPSITAKLSDLQTANTATNESAEQFAKLTAQYTDGKIHIKVYPAGELGAAATETQALESGTIQFYASPDLSGVVPSTQVIALPYLFPSIPVASKVLNGPVARRALWSKFPAQGLQVLGVWSLGDADIYTVNHPINTVKDLSGLRIRIWDPGVGVDVIKALGGEPVNITSTEVVTAFATHAIDGGDDPTSTMFTSKWTSSGGYLALTNDAVITEPVIMSSKFWSQLSKPEQAAVTKAFDQTIASNLTQAEAVQASSIKGMQQQGVKITHPSQAAFQAALKPVYAKVQAMYGSVVPQLEAAVKAAEQ
jgi:tripartite ATP-independent transporter DctP family solute receptor